MEAGIQRSEDAVDACPESFDQALLLGKLGSVWTRGKANWALQDNDGPTETVERLGYEVMVVGHQVGWLPSSYE